MDRYLFQNEVAAMIGVSTDSVTNWENNRNSPQAEQCPSIFAFLGYYPFPFNPESFPSNLKRYRLENGLSIKEFARRIGSEPRSVVRWESGKGMPVARCRKVIEQFEFGGTIVKPPSE